jgi:hypothetical protein
MSKTAATTTSAAPGAKSTKHHASPSALTSQTETPELSTQQIIAHIWDTLKWGNTLRIAFIMAVAGITAFAALAGLGLLAHAAGPATAWPVTVTVTIQIARRRRRRR